jgi:hypothetical protein
MIIWNRVNLAIRTLVNHSPRHYDAIDEALSLGSPGEHRADKAASCGTKTVISQSPTRTIRSSVTHKRPAHGRGARKAPVAPPTALGMPWAPGCFLRASFI